MCIRDRLPFELKSPLITLGPLSITNVEMALYAVIGVWAIRVLVTCLLYTSDAADERSSVDLGGRRIIQKKQRIERR